MNETVITLEDWNNLLVLTKKANITGNEALPVVVLQQKISKIIEGLSKPAEPENGKPK